MLIKRDDIFCLLRKRKMSSLIVGHFYSFYQAFFNANECYRRSRECLSPRICLRFRHGDVVVLHHFQHSIGRSGRCTRLCRREGKKRCGRLPSPQAMSKEVERETINAKEKIETIHKGYLLIVGRSLPVQCLTPVSRKTNTTNV